MLDLIVVAVVMMSNNGGVMIAVILVCHLRRLIDVPIGQRLYCVPKPGAMRDSTAEQHRGCREGLKRQRQQNDCGSSPEKLLRHIKRISHPRLAPSASPEQCVQRANQSQVLDHHQNNHSRHDRCRQRHMRRKVVQNDAVTGDQNDRSHQ
jgi:hypothetical protein